MFNKSISALKKIVLLVSVFFILFSCDKDITITFKEQHVEKTEYAIIDINYPMAEGTQSVANKINSTIENFLASELNMGEKAPKNRSLNDAIKAFDKEYKSFKDDFSDSTQQWEALIESEVTYNSETVICVAVNSYLDTGGAHGNSHVTFLNFDKKTGELLTQNDLIKDTESFKKLVQPYFEKATKPLSNDETVEDIFFGEDFKLSENIGFSEDGVILLYNVYEIASYAQGITEFTIPYKDAKPFLNLNLE